MGILIVAHLLRGLTGVIARSILPAREIAVVSWSEGAAHLVPLAIWAAIPFAALAVAIPRMLRNVATRRRKRMPAWARTAIGAILGLAAFQRYTLFYMMA